MLEYVDSRYLINVCSTEHHSTWRTAASTPQTLLVGSMCSLLAAVSCSYRQTVWHCMFSHWAFSVAGPEVWNSLPDYLQDLSHYFDSFRQNLETSFAHITSVHSSLEALLLCVI